MKCILLICIIIRKEFKPEKGIVHFPGSLTKLAWDWTDCSCLLLRLVTLLLANTQKGQLHSKVVGIPPGANSLFIMQAINMFVKNL